ncbi:hypothetical protein, partial [Roseicella frigidaeris]|uniref:hypothetical protein n=1 Tax=Roseicella frigidaeris TaxID=2230885 RepID=UPI0010577948
MGQAKRRREEGVRVVYHHTSTLRTNLLWMSGVIQVEGQSEGVIHPDLGEILTDATLRRPMRDFPPLVWFTRQIVVPRCLQQSTMMLRDKGTGEVRAIEAPHGAANAIALNADSGEVGHRFRRHVGRPFRSMSAGVAARPRAVG